MKRLVLDHTTGEFVRIAVGLYSLAASFFGEAIDCHRGTMHYRRLITALIGCSSVAHGYVLTQPTASRPISSTAVDDVTRVGSLTVPNVGCGTIAWSSDKGEFKCDDFLLRLSQLSTHKIELDALPT